MNICQGYRARCECCGLVKHHVCIGHDLWDRSVDSSIDTSIKYGYRMTLDVMAIVWYSAKHGHVKRTLLERTDGGHTSISSSSRDRTAATNLRYYYSSESETSTKLIMLMGDQALRHATAGSGSFWLDAWGIVKQPLRCCESLWQFRLPTPRL